MKGHFIKVTEQDLAQKIEKYLNMSIMYNMYGTCNFEHSGRIVRGNEETP